MVRLSFAVHHKLSSSIRHISKKVRPRITKLYTDIYADLAYSQPGLQQAMTSSATSARHFLKFEKRPKMPPPTALCRISVARSFVCPANWWASCSPFGSIYSIYASLEWDFSSADRQRRMHIFVIRFIERDVQSFRWARLGDIRQH